MRAATASEAAATAAAAATGLMEMKLISAELS